MLSLLILEKDKPISKRHAASLLWPEASAERARDCLYKTLTWLKTHQAISNAFGLQISRNNLCLSADIQSDLAEFDRFYSHRDDIHCCEKAVDLYKGPLFWKEYYNWIDVWQSHYEIRYADMIQTIAAYHSHRGNREFGKKYLNLLDT